MALEYFDNGARQSAQSDDRTEERREWRLAVWQARAELWRAMIQRDPGTQSRIATILAGAVEGTPPARLEPSTVAHASRGLHAVVMHSSRIGMVRGTARHVRGSLDPQSVWDTVRGQGGAQTRSDYFADAAASRVLRSDAQGSAPDWLPAIGRAARALQVWARATRISRAPWQSEREPEPAEPEPEREPAFRTWNRSLARLRRAQAAARAARAGVDCAPVTLEQFQRRSEACQGCDCHTCTTLVASLRAIRAAATDCPDLPIVPRSEPDSAPWMNWQLRKARLLRRDRLRRARAAQV